MTIGLITLKITKEDGSRVWLRCQQIEDAYRIKFNVRPTVSSFISIINIAETIVFVSFSIYIWFFGIDKIMAYQRNLIVKLLPIVSPVWGWFIAFLFREGAIQLLFSLAIWNSHKSNSFSQRIIINAVADICQFMNWLSGDYYILVGVWWHFTLAS